MDDIRQLPGLPSADINPTDEMIVYRDGRPLRTNFARVTEEAVAAVPGGATWSHPSTNPVTLANGAEVTITHPAVTDEEIIIGIIERIPPAASVYAIPAVPTINGSGEYGAWAGGASGTYQGQNAFERTAATWLGDRNPDPQWIAVDLGGVKSIDRFKIRKTNQNDNYNPGKFKIQYSDTGLTGPWTDAVDQTGSAISYTDDWYEATFTPVEARYWRLYITEGINGSHADGYGCGEFELYTQAQDDPTYEQARADTYISNADYGVRRVDATTTKVRNQSGSEKTIYVNVITP